MPVKLKSVRLLSGVLLLGLSLAPSIEAVAQSAVTPYTVTGDAISASLTGKQGDGAKGRAIVANRQVGLCMLCHSASVIPEEKFQGDLAPDLSGAGSRWNIGELDRKSTRLNSSHT